MPPHVRAHTGGTAHVFHSLGRSTMSKTTLPAGSAQVKTESSLRPIVATLKKLGR